MTPCSFALALALSAHGGLEGDYSGIHPALKCDREDTGLIAGLYLNSEDRISTYAGVKFAGDGPFWAEVGLVTGYGSEPVLPMLRVGAEIAPRVDVFAAPAYEETRHGANFGVVMGVEIALGR